jgi:hypothetical protein
VRKAITAIFHAFMAAPFWASAKQMVRHTAQATRFAVMPRRKSFLVLFFKKELLP